MNKVTHQLKPSVPKVKDSTHNQCARYISTHWVGLGALSDFQYYTNYRFIEFSHEWTRMYSVPCIFFKLIYAQYLNLVELQF